ncbi:MAG TPA: hypothetical protein VFB65_17720, partial [Pyrinomonadaceae bacterium]|nr:hypothetical protein [Pyrinomonadaceae bacterium]
VVVDGRPGLTWMDMSDVELKEPFFQQTVDRVRDEEPWRDAGLFTQFDALLQLDQVLPRVQPSGFIFHSSRCGSTLVANVCRALDDAIVVSEANPIDKLVARFITDGGDPVKESLYSVLLRAVVNALAYRKSGNELRVFVKFSCCGVSQLERIRRIWPNVPWIFLYRDPVETIVSNMTTVPAWLLDEDHRILAHITGTTPAAVAEMSLEERCARSIGSFYSTAHGVANDHGMLLNYNQISVTNILDFFNVSPSAEELERITSGSRVYSKEVSGAREFVPDAEAKQNSASNRIRQLAEEFAIGPYQLLERKS